MSKKKTLRNTFIIFSGALVGVVLLWEATSLEVNPDLPLAIDWGKIGAVVLDKIGDVIRQFLEPR